MVEETILGKTPMAIGGAYKTAHAGRILKGHNPLGSHDVRARVAEKTNRDGSMDGDRNACENRTFKGETGAVKRLTAETLIPSAAQDGSRRAGRQWFGVTSHKVTQCVSINVVHDKL